MDKFIDRVNRWMQVDEAAPPAPRQALQRALRWLLLLPVGWWALAVVRGAGPFDELLRHADLYAYLLLAGALPQLLLHRAWPVEGGGDGLDDARTGLYAASHFMRRLREELGHAKRKGRPLALLLADIDRLDGINTAYGRAAGDRVLKGVAAELRRSVRQIDMAAHLGNGRFALLLRDSRPDDARRVAVRIHAAVAQAAVPTGRGAIGAVSLAAGVVCYWRSGSVGAAALMSLAEETLRQAKTAPGERVAVAGELREGELPGTDLPPRP